MLSLNSHLFCSKHKKMGLDLSLIAIPEKGKFIIDKARNNMLYSIELNKILNIELLFSNLKMTQANQDETESLVLLELIEDSKEILKLYPNQNEKEYCFYSKTRGYETLNYLLKKYYEKTENHPFVQNYKLFYGGIDIDYGKQFIRLHYINKEKVCEICGLMESISFNQLLDYYNFDILNGEIYKLTNPENLSYLEVEYNELKQFYIKSKNINAFIIVQIS